MSRPTNKEFENLVHTYMSISTIVHAISQVESPRSHLAALFSALPTKHTCLAVNQTRPILSQYIFKIPFPRNEGINLTKPHKHHTCTSVSATRFSPAHLTSPHHRHVQPPPPPPPPPLTASTTQPNRRPRHAAYCTLPNYPKQ